MTRSNIGSNNPVSLGAVCHLETWVNLKSSANFHAIENAWQCFMQRKYPMQNAHLYFYNDLSSALYEGFIKRLEKNKKLLLLANKTSPLGHHYQSLANKFNDVDFYDVGLGLDAICKMISSKKPACILMDSLIDCRTCDNRLNISTASSDESKSSLQHQIITAVKDQQPAIRIYMDESLTSPSDSNYFNTAQAGVHASQIDGLIWVQAKDVCVLFDTHDKSQSSQCDLLASSGAMIQGYFNAVYADQCQSLVNTASLHIKEVLAKCMIEFAAIIKSNEIRISQQGLRVVMSASEAAIEKAIKALNCCQNNDVLIEQYSPRLISLLLPVKSSQALIPSVIKTMLGLDQAREFEKITPVSSLKTQRHDVFVDTLIKKTNNEPIDESRLMSFLNTELDQIIKQDQSSHYYLVMIDGSNIDEFIEQIKQIQINNYESVRRTDINKFIQGANDKNGVCLAIIATRKQLDAQDDCDLKLHPKDCNDRQLCAIGFASTLSLHQDEKGVIDDPFFDDPSALYVLDVTVDKVYRQELKGAGGLLKMGLNLIACARGASKIQGRNRDRLAAPMLGINLSYGAYELQYLVDDYNDNLKHRDAFYYTQSLNWSTPDWQHDERIRLEHMPVNEVIMTWDEPSIFIKQTLHQLCAIMPKGFNKINTIGNLINCYQAIKLVLSNTRQVRQIVINGSDDEMQLLKAMMADDSTHVSLMTDHEIKDKSLSAVNNDFIINVCVIDIEKQKMTLQDVKNKVATLNDQPQLFVIIKWSSGCVLFVKDNNDPVNVDLKYGLITQHKSAQSLALAMCHAKSLLL